MIALAIGKNGGKGALDWLRTIDNKQKRVFNLKLNQNNINIYLLVDGNNMKYVEWKKEYLKFTGEGSRHASQKGFYSTLLLERLEKQFPECLEIEVTPEFIKIVESSTYHLRCTYGFRWDDAKKETTSYQMYLNFIKELQIKNFLTELPKILLYRSKNNELAVKFADEKMLNLFIRQMGGFQKYPSGYGCPQVYKDNPTTLFIAGSFRKGGLVVEFPNKEMRTKFTRLLKLLGSGVASILDEGVSLYITDASIITTGKSAQIPMPLELINCTRKKIISSLFIPVKAWTDELTHIVKGYDHECKSQCYTKK